MKTITLSLSLLLASLLGAQAQVVTTSPPILQTNSTDVVITYHADRGSRGLMDLPQGEKVYAHTGVVTSLSDGGWTHAPQWLDNSPKYELTRVGENEYTLTIGEINAYYGITDPQEVVEKLAFVFRNATGTREGKTAEGGDIFVPVAAPGFVIDFSAQPSAPMVAVGHTVELRLYATLPAALSITLNGSEVATAQEATQLAYTYVFPAPGDYEFAATGATADASLTRTLAFACVAASPQADYPGGVPKMGPVENPDGSVTFCLAAPGKESVSIVGSWNGYAVNSAGVMAYQDYEGQRYFWTTVPALADGQDQIYFFIVDGQTYVGDPYAELVLDPWNDKYIPASVYPDLPPYPADHVSGTPVALYNSSLGQYDWQVENFTGVPQSSLIIYELLIRDFTGTEGEARAEGTIEGVLEKLPYIKALGVNAVELMPIQEFNGNNSWGYNPNFYFAPDKAYGTPSDYRRLVDECHKMGLAVIIDVVFNQSDGLHPWYRMYKIEENPFYNGSAPHAYSVLNDWKQENPLVQQQFEDCLRYWLKEYKVDGYRFDLVKGLGNNDSYGNTYNPLTNTYGPTSDEKTNAYNQSRIDRMARFHAVMREVNPDAYFINEDLATAKEENALGADGDLSWANANHGACNFAKGTLPGSSLVKFYAPQDDSRTWGTTVSYAESHDEQRVAYVQQTEGLPAVRDNAAVAMRRLGSVAAQMIMAPGAHMIWQFEELGDAQNTKNNYGNDTSPKRVPWSLMDNPENASLLQNYRELCAARGACPELFLKEGVSASISLAKESERKIGLRGAEKELYLVVNPSVTASATIKAPWGQDLTLPGYSLMSASAGTSPTASASGVLLEPGAYALYGNEAAAAGVDTPAADLSDASPLVYAVDGSIVISGPYRQACVYTLSGQAASLHSLLPGLYIVLVDSRPYKVLVR